MAISDIVQSQPMASTGVRSKKVANDFSIQIATVNGSGS